VVERYADVEARYGELGGYQLEGRANGILAGLGFAPERVGDDVGTLSGGWKMRVALAQILLAEPDVLLLDEPTNYLDLESILWLEAWLKAYQGAVVMTCHDREIMNRIVSKIVEIDGGAARTYGGNYEFYERARAEASARYEAEYARQQAMLAKESRFIERFAAHAAKAAQVRRGSRSSTRSRSWRRRGGSSRSKFGFRAPSRSGDDVVRCEGLRKAYGARTIHDGLNPDRAPQGALGGDGRERRRQVDPAEDDGRRAPRPMAARVTLGAGGDDGLLRPAHDGQPRRRRTILEELRPTRRPPTRARCATWPARSASTTTTSQSRSACCRAARRRGWRWPSSLRRAQPDDPRRAHQPPRHRHQARADRALAEYEGTLVFVSHDRQFLRALATRVLELSGGGPRVYGGSYDEYVASTGREAPGMRALE
jgi:energy-coupling factor transporter ATP-binding protein EcfA2